MKTAPFTCPKCGITLELPKVANRKLCPHCAEAKLKDRSKEYYKNVTKDKKETLEKAPQQPKPPKTTEDELTARIMAQVKKQCHKCHFWNKQEGAKTGFCDYYLRYGIGHRVDHGNGPGDCRCFKPKKAKTKAERVDRCRITLAQSEADHAG